MLLSGLKAVDIKNPVLPPLVFSVQDTVDNALPGPFTLEITAVAEAQSSGTLPTLLNAPVRKKIGHTSKDWSVSDVRYLRQKRVYLCDAVTANAWRDEPDLASGDSS